jgi:Flp pilus assembly protein TadD
VPPLNPETRQRLLTEAEDLMKQGKADEGIRLLQTEVANNPDRRDLRLALGNYAARAERFDLAIATFQQLLDGMDRTSKGAVDIELRLAETYRRKGDFAAAISTLQQAHAVDPTNGLVLRNLALSFDNAGRKAEAKNAYRNAVDLNPKDGVSLNNLAYLLSQTGVDDKDALEYAERAVKAIPGVHEVSDTLAWVYLTQKQTPQALTILNNIVAMAPENSEYRYHLGLALVQTGDPFAARQAFQQALAGRPSPELQQSIRKSLASLDR